MNSYHFNLGNSASGPIGFCAWVKAENERAAVERLRTLLRKEIAPDYSFEIFEKGEQEWCEVYFNLGQITEADICDMEKVKDVVEQPKHPPIPEGILTPSALDELLDSGVPASALVGRKVDLHGREIGTLILSRKGLLLLPITMHCGRCHHMPITCYLGSGLHNGAWCYCFDPETDQYLANLRDEIPVCPACRQISQVSG